MLLWFNCLECPGDKVRHCRDTRLAAVSQVVAMELFRANIVMRTYFTTKREEEYMTERLRFAFVLMFTALFGWTAMPAQQSLEGTVEVDGAKRTYAIYIPSTYAEGTANPLMLALHPFNPARWNAISWRDTLIAFAESNGLILVCPDGGADGHLLSERADTLGATAVLDSVDVWYNIDAKRTYAMGFSVGGGTTYEYGITNAWRFNGFIPIGAAPPQFTTIEEFAGARGKPFYIINGQNDSPNIRVTPVAAALKANEAFIDSIILPGVGHTIDFTGRNEVFTTAYKWIDSVNCANAPSGVEEHGSSEAWSLQFMPNVLRNGQSAIVRSKDESRLSSPVVHTLDGRIATDASITSVDEYSARIDARNLSAGVYFLEVTVRGERRTIRFIVQ